MERHLKQYPDQPLPLIYPFVIYNGEQPWDGSVDLFALSFDPSMANLNDKTQIGTNAAHHISSI